MEILNKYRKYTDIAELRVDCLNPDERLLIRQFPQRADIPVILTIRRDIDGGYFNSGDGARINLMARGLAYADADKRRNFAYLDIEEDLNVPSLEEAARTFGIKIIRSYHNVKGTDTDLSEKFRSMLRSEDAIIKISVYANSTSDVYRLMQTGKEFKKQAKILIASGHYGIYSRILARQFGSFLSYTSALAEPDALPAAPGQIEITELVNNYNFKSIKNDTKIFGVLGNPLKKTASPVFFNSIFKMEGISAVYVPFPSDSVDVFFNMIKDFNIQGLSVTVPFKEEVIEKLDRQTEEIVSYGACNTIYKDGADFVGTNTDGKGFSDSLLAFLNRTHLKKIKTTIIGAGGVAKAVAYELHRLGARVLILNRSAHKAQSLAAKYKFAWNALDKHGIEMMNKYKDLIIQTTTAGMEGSGFDDPIPMYHFTGKESVMDLVYSPEMTPFLKRAQDSGCKIQNGYDMLIRQAQYQYTYFFGRDFPKHLMSRIKTNGK